MIGFGVVGYSPDSQPNEYRPGAYLSESGGPLAVPMPLVFFFQFPHVILLGKMEKKFVLTGIQNDPRFAHKKPS